MKILRKIRNYKRLLKEHKMYLKSGFYILSFNLRSYRHILSKKTIKLPKEKITLKRILIWLFSFRFIIFINNKNQTFFEGDLVYFLNTLEISKVDIKIFDQKNNLMLVCYPNEDRFMLAKKRFDCAKLIFPTNEKKFDKKKLLSSEAIINGFSDKNKDLETLKKLFNFYNNYFKKMVETNNFKKNNVGDILIMQHGDLSEDNFTIYNSNLIFIDFDNLNYYPLYFDIFFYIYHLKEHGFPLFYNMLSNNKLDSCFCLFYNYKVSDYIQLFEKYFYGVMNEKRKI